VRESRGGRGQEKREGKGKREWDARPAGWQGTGAPHWQKTGLVMTLT